MPNLAIPSPPSPSHSGRRSRLGHRQAPYRSHGKGSWTTAAMIAVLLDSGTGGEILEAHGSGGRLLTGPRPRAPILLSSDTPQATGSASGIKA